MIRLVLFSIVLLASHPDVSLAQTQETKRVDPAEASKTLDHLIESIEADDVRERLRAVENLRSLGDLAPLPALPALTRALEDDSISIRIEAAQALGSFGLAGKDALSKLTAQLDNDDVWLVESVAMAIGCIGGPDNKSVVRRLLILKGPKIGDALIHGSYLRAFPRASLSKLIELLIDENDAVREQAAIVIGLARKPAIEALVRQSQHAKPSVGAILAVAKENRGFYRELAAVAAIKIDPENAEGWELLHQAFEQKSSLRIERVLKNAGLATPYRYPELTNGSYIMTLPEQGMSFRSRAILIRK